MRLVDKFKAFTLKEILFQFISTAAIRFLTRSNYNGNLLPYIKIVKDYNSKGYKVIRIDKNTIVIYFNNERYFIRRYGSDIKVFDQIVISEEYKNILSLISRCGLDNTEVNIIDCGSNIGLFSAWILNRIKVNNIISIEADYENYTFQKYFIKQLGYENKIKLFNRAVWSDSESELKISSDFRDGQNWAKRVEPVTENENSYTVKSISLNQVFDDFENRDVHILKIDIEGAEKAVFENETSFDKMLINTKIIAIEIHEEVNCTIMILDKLYKYGFYLEKVGETTFGYKK